MGKVKLRNMFIGPFPVILAGADVKGKPNYCAVGACGAVSREPVLYISLHIAHYTTIGVRENGYFSINIPSADLVQKTDYCGLVSGRTTDKSGIFTSFYDEIGKAPLIAECSMNILCKVIQTVPINDFEVFLGEIVATYMNEECLTDGQPDPLKIDPLILIGRSYLRLGQAAGFIYKEGLTIKKHI